MEEREVRAEVREVMARVLGDGALPPGPGVARARVPEWDSLKHIALVYALEDALDVTFAAEELGALDSEDAIVAAVRSARS